VRCSSISPLTSIIENCTNREILERVYTQLQSFLSDPIQKDEYLLQIELLKTFRRISNKCMPKFREEFMLPYLAILTMQIKNAINENEYEFRINMLNSILYSLNNYQNSIQSTGSCAGKDLSQNSTSHQQIQNQQQDLAKICILLFDIYQKICPSQENILSISKQSIQESLLPGLNHLNEIFHHKIIQNSSISLTSSSIHSIATLTNQNEFSTQLDKLIFKVEHYQHLPDTSTPAAVASNLDQTTPVTAVSSSSSSSPQTNPPTTNGSVADQSTHSKNLMGDLINSSMASSITTPVTTLANQLSNSIATNAENSNFKSFFSKGINNIKDHYSKDKLSNFQFLANKAFKK
jgi:hypothetical protein